MKIRPVFLWLLLPLVFVVLAGCPDTVADSADDGKTELPPPPEAELFANLTLSRAYKGFNDGNPIMTQEFGADPNVLVWDNRLYVFMTADALLFDANGNIRAEDYGTIRSLRVLSSGDLVNWTHHPDIQVAGPGGVGHPWAINSWAPALAAREVDGRMQVFLYFANGAPSVGVIAADHPLGPWRSPRTSPIVNSATPGVHNVPGWPNTVWIFDPAVLVDDDGRAFLYFGGGTPPGGSAADFTSNHPWPNTKRVIELAPDMVNVVGEAVPLRIPFSFEAIEINRIGDIYVLSYSSNPQVGHFATRPDEFPYAAKIGSSFGIAYMTGDNPMGPFEFRGLVLPNPAEMFGLPHFNNNHHRMFEFRGIWYIAYHSKLLQAAKGVNLEFNYRSIHIDYVNIHRDGRIDVVEGTRRGVAQSGRFNPFQMTDAATMAIMAGISTREYEREGSAWNHMKITDIDSGDWVALRGVDFGDRGSGQFFARVNPPETGMGVIQIRVGQGLGGRAAGYVILEPGKTDYTIDLLRTVSGVQDVVFVFYGEGWDFKEWRFIPR